MSTQPPGYEELSACLNANNSDLTAAECHAMLCGILSCQTTLNAQEWSRRILSCELETEPGENLVGSHIHEQDVEMIKRLIADTIAQLEDPELGFFPLLPDDDDSIEARSAALSEWCHGYLYGLSLGGLKEFNQLSEQAQEFAQDIVEISGLEIADEDSEANEEAFFEVVEYLRMGVLMMCDEIAAPGATPASSQSESPSTTVH